MVKIEHDFRCNGYSLLIPNTLGAGIRLSPAYLVPARFYSYRLPESIMAERIEAI